MLDISYISAGSMFSTLFNVERKTGAMVDGIWTVGTTTDIENIPGSITPATANDMLILTEGERQKETFRLITQFELIISKNNQEADAIIYLGHKYRTVGPSRWEGNGFYDVLIQKEDDD